MGEAGLVRSGEGLGDGLREVDALQREIEGDSAVAALGLRRALLQPRLQLPRRLREGG